MESEKSLNTDSPSLVFDSSINEEEKAEILKEIEEAVSASKSPIGEAAQKLHPVKKGMVFPVVINIIMFAMVAAAFFISNMLFEQRQGEMSRETQFYLSAEGKLLEELRRESDEALRAKDQQIGAIQEELAELDRRSSELNANMEATIQAREEELRREMQAAIDAERARLAGAGTTQEEIQAKLREMESQLANQNNQALESFREESSRALEAQREELERTRALNQSLLDDANSEKLRLEEESRNREAEMTSRFEEEKAELEASTQEARAALSSLARLQEQQFLLDDQVTGVYRSIIEKLDDEEFDSALGELGSLRSLLTSENVQSIPAYAKKQTVDLFILDTLENTIETVANRAEMSTSNLAAAADLLIAAEELAVTGLAAYESGNQKEAEEYLLQALEAIPRIGESYSVLNSMASTTRKTEMEAAVAMAEEHTLTGDFNEAVRTYSRAVGEGVPDNKELASSSMNSLISLYENRYSDLLSSSSAAIGDLEGEHETALSALEDQHERTINRIDLENQQSLSDLEQEKDEEISTLQQKIAEQETALALQKIQLADAETAMMEAAASTEQELEELRASQALNREDLEAGYEETLNELEEGYQAALTEEIEAIKADYELVLQEKDISLTAQTQELLNLQETLTAGETLMADLEEKYSQLQSEYDSYSQTLQNLQIESDDMADQLAGYKLLGSDYTILKNRMDRLMSTGNPEDYFQAEELLVDFLKEDLGAFLPGAADIMEKTADARVITAGDTLKKEGITEGRSEALADILKYTGYLAEGDEDSREALLEEIQEKAKTDNRYSQVIQEIEDLVTEGAASHAASVLGRPQLLGTVTRVNGNRITIELLADLPIAEGMAVSVRRKIRRSDEVTLADGKITTAGRDSAEAEVSGNLGVGRVEIADLVYVTLN